MVWLKGGGRDIGGYKGIGLGMMVLIVFVALCIRCMRPQLDRRLRVAFFIWRLDLRVVVIKDSSKSFGRVWCLFSLSGRLRGLFLYER